VRVEMVKINSEKPEPSLIRYAADQIRAGEVLGMPTDTFYGLAADPFNLRAVERVYEIKSRSRHKPRYPKNFMRWQRSSGPGR